MSVRQYIAAFGLVAVALLGAIDLITPISINASVYGAAVAVVGALGFKDITALLERLRVALTNRERGAR